MKLPIVYKNTQNGGPQQGKPLCSEDFLGKEIKLRQRNVQKVSVSRETHEKSVTNQWTWWASKHVESQNSQNSQNITRVGRLLDRTWGMFGNSLAGMKTWSMWGSKIRRPESAWLVDILCRIQTVSMDPNPSPKSKIQNPKSKIQNPNGAVWGRHKKNED